MSNNPLYNTFANQPINNNELAGFVQQVKDFKNTFRGNAKEEVERLLNSGQMSQQQFNHYSQMAQHIVGLMGN